MKLPKAPLLIGLLLAMAELALLFAGMGGQPVSGIVLCLMFYALAFSVRGSKAFSGLSFTLQIFVFVSLALYLPSAFTNWGFDTRALAVPRCSSSCSGWARR